jgi:hypothetical protein
MHAIKTISTFKNTFYTPNIIIINIITILTTIIQRINDIKNTKNK